MNETTLLLAPTPDARGEFLVTVDCQEIQLPFEMTLNQYSREKKWIELPAWKKMSFKIVPGQERRYPGFIKYLKERKKSAWGTFISDDSSNKKGIFLIPHYNISNNEIDDLHHVHCHIIMDQRLVLKSPHAKNPPQSLVNNNNPPRDKLQSQRKQAQLPKRAPLSNKKVTTKSTSRSSGLLGNLLGAQRRTNHHMDTTNTVKNSTNCKGEAGQTAAQIISKFRIKMEEKLLEFQSSASVPVLKIPVSLTTESKLMAADEELSMDVLKYIIYEQVEEINEAWIAVREPSEFLDEATFVVYKEGHCPPEILQEYNKGDLPDEVRNQERAIRESTAKAEQKKSQQRFHGYEQAAHTMNSNITTALNQNKRDRRTIEEIQREKEQQLQQDNINSKRQKC